MSKAKYLTWSNVLIIAFILFLPFQPPQIQFNSMLMIALGILSLISLNEKVIVAYRARFNFFWMPVFWLLLLLSLAWSIDLDSGLNSIFKAIPLFLLPLVFGMHEIKPPVLRAWKRTFVVVCAVASIIGLVMGGLKFAESGMSYHFSYQYVCAFLPPAYTSLYIALAMVILIEEIRRKLNNTFWFHAAIWLFVIHLAVIFSRSGIILLLVLATVYTVELVRQGLRRHLVAFVLLLALGAVGLMTNVKVQDRISGVVKIAQGQFEYEETSSSLGARMWIWNAARELILEKPVIGYGAGGEKVALRSKFEEKELSYGIERGYNAHNQYLQYALAAGVFGMLLFVFILGRSFVISLQQGNFFGWMTILLLALAFFTESMLERQAGIFLLALFYPLIELQNSFAKTHEV